MAKNKAFLRAKPPDCPLVRRGVLRREQKVREMIRDYDRLRRRSHRRRGHRRRPLPTSSWFAGASVTLLDCRGAGLGATQAAAGMLRAVPRRIRAASSSARCAKSRDVRRVRRARVARFRTCASDIAAPDRCRSRRPAIRSDELQSIAAGAAHARASSASCSTRTARGTQSRSSPPTLLSALLVPNTWVRRRLPICRERCLPRLSSTVRALRVPARAQRHRRDETTASRFSSTTIV